MKINTLLYNFCLGVLVTLHSCTQTVHNPKVRHTLDTKSEAATILLSIESISSLPDQHYNKLINTINVSKNPQDILNALVKFYDKKLINQATLDAEVQKLYLNSKPIVNLQTLLSELVNSKTESYLHKQITKCKANMTVFHGKKLCITSKNRDTLLEGQVVSATYDDTANIANFVITNNSQKTSVQLHLYNKYPTLAILQREGDADTVKIYPTDRFESDRLFIIKNPEKSHVIDATQHAEVIKSELKKIAIKLNSDKDKKLIKIMRDYILNHDVNSFSSETKFVENLLKNEGSAISDTVDFITASYEKLGKSISKGAVLDQILKECLQKPASSELNVSKLDAINSKAEEQAKLMSGKDLILFVGPTGAGKSSTVSYFMGLPMKSGFLLGTETVALDNFDKNSFGGVFPKIGQSIGISETLYATGYKIFENTLDTPTVKQIQALDINIKNLILCDSPGFFDTRGTEYEICTNNSIDTTILNAQRVKALVLVATYDTVISNRANNLMCLLGVMKERFPKITKVDSQISNSFHLIITKWKSELELFSFENRLNQYLDEDQQTLNKLLSGNPLDIRIFICNERIEFFRLMLAMSRSKRIEFINIENTFVKDDILIKYLKSPGIQKEDYVSFLQGGGDYVQKYKAMLEDKERAKKLKDPKLIKEKQDDLDAEKRELANKKKEIEEISKKKEKLEAEIKKI